MNRHDVWASRAYMRAGRLDNNYINKINSYLHKYLSESDDLWINPTPLNERDPIKISVVINKLTHMEFGPSCQFNNNPRRVWPKLDPEISTPLGLASSPAG